MSTPKSFTKAWVLRLPSIGEPPRPQRPSKCICRPLLDKVSSWTTTPDEPATANGIDFASLLEMLLPAPAASKACVKHLLWSCGNQLNPAIQTSPARRRDSKRRVGSKRASPWANMTAIGNEVKAARTTSLCACTDASANCKAEPFCRTAIKHTSSSFCNSSSTCLMDNPSFSTKASTNSLSFRRGELARAERFSCAAVVTTSQSSNKGGAAKRRAKPFLSTAVSTSSLSSRREMSKTSKAKPSRFTASKPISRSFLISSLANSSSRGRRFAMTRATSRSPRSASLTSGESLRNPSRNSSSICSRTFSRDGKPRRS
mmetsp:Transcript_51058/g.108478  ORF Transcript_51058/g.108478 Transcript_51058/m.108478 type:complete len:316 (+) Transcript_51058:163-1110(+)